MFDEINLVIKNDKNVPKKEQLERIRLASFLALFLVGILSVFVFLVNLRFSTTGIKNQQSQVLQTLSSYNDTVAKIYVLNSRLDDIGIIMNKRKDYSQDVEQIIKLTGSAVAIENYEYDQQKNLSLSISSSSLNDLNDFLNNLLKLQDNGTVGDVVMTGLKSDPAQGYNVSLEVLTQ